MLTHSNLLHLRPYCSLPQGEIVVKREPINNNKKTITSNKESLEETLTGSVSAQQTQQLNNQRRSHVIHGTVNRSKKFEWITKTICLTLSKKTQRVLRLYSQIEVKSFTVRIAARKTQIGSNRPHSPITHRIKEAVSKYGGYLSGPQDKWRLGGKTAYYSTSSSVSPVL